MESSSHLYSFALLLVIKFRLGFAPLIGHLPLPRLCQTRTLIPTFSSIVTNSWQDFSLTQSLFLILEFCRGATWAMIKRSKLWRRMKVMMWIVDTRKMKSWTSLDITNELLLESCGDYWSPKVLHVAYMQNDGPCTTARLFWLARCSMSLLHQRASIFAAFSTSSGITIERYSISAIIMGTRVLEIVRFNRRHYIRHHQHNS